eukprot:gene3813-4207_t
MAETRTETRNCRTAVLCGPRSIEVRDRPALPLGPCGVEIAVASVGICGTDFNYFTKCAVGSLEMQFPEVHSSSFGAVMGHEAAGTVVAVGSPGLKGGDGTLLEVGDRVALEPGSTCGHCNWCQHPRIGHPLR